MDNIKYVSLSQFQIEPTLDDKFWLEKIKRFVDDCESTSTLKEVATMLATIATTRRPPLSGSNITQTYQTKEIAPATYSGPHTTVLEL